MPFYGDLKTDRSLRWCGTVPTIATRRCQRGRRSSHFRRDLLPLSPPLLLTPIMAENRNFSPNQQKIIKRFYDNRDQLDEQHLAENVTNLYLATGEKQKAKIWKTVEEMMGRLGVPESRIKHILEKKDPAILAEVVKDLQTGKIKKTAPPAKPQ